MAIAASGIESIMVQADPVGVQVRLRLRTTVDFDPSYKILGCDHRRNGVTQVTFQADRLLSID